MELRDTRLDRYRAAVADHSSGRALHDLLTELSATLRDVEITKPTRERVPAPYPQDHPRCDLLRCDTLHALARAPDGSSWARPDGGRGGSAGRHPRHRGGRRALAAPTSALTGKR